MIKKYLFAFEMVHVLYFISFLYGLAAFNNIIINLFIEGSLISAKALFCLRALFGATRIHSLYEDGLFD